MNDGTPMRRLMADLLTRHVAAGKLGDNRWEEAWKQAAPEFKTQTRCGQARRGVLEILVAHSSAMQEVAFQKEKIMERLKQLLPEEELEDIRFRIGSLQ